MSARRESQNWDQPNDINSTLNEMFYGKPRGLNPDLNTYGHEDLMLTSNVSCTRVWVVPSSDAL